MKDPDLATFVRHSRLQDAPEFTGPTLREDGTLGIYSRGHGMTCGPLQPAVLRSFAFNALAIADQLEGRAERAATMAAGELARIVMEPGHG